MRRTTMLLAAALLAAPALPAAALPAALPATALPATALTATAAPEGAQVLSVDELPGSRVSVLAAAPTTGTSAPAPGTVRATVTAGGTPVAATVEPLLSPRAAVALVIDASAEGEAALEDGGRSGAADLLLQLPPDTRSAVVADRRPPAVLAPAATGVSDDLRATTALQGSGRHATADALDLALRQLPPWPTVQPVVVLFTTAPDGGEAAALGERLRRAHALLAVVQATAAPGADVGYWPGTASATGGTAVIAPPGRTIPAFDAVADALRSRVLVTFARPSAGPVRLQLGTAAPVPVELPAIPAAPAPDNGPNWLWPIGVVALLALLVAGATWALRGDRKPAVAGPDLDPEPLEPLELELDPEPPLATAPDPVPAPRSDVEPEPEPPVEAAPTPPEEDEPELPPDEQPEPEDRLPALQHAWAADQPDVDPALLRWTATAATLAGAADGARAHAALALLPPLAGDDAAALRERLIQWWADVTPGPCALNPLLPPRLGRFLVARTVAELEDRQDGTLEETFDALARTASDEQLARALDLLTEIRPGHPAVDWAADGLLQRNLASLADRAADAPGSGLPGALLGLLTARLLEELTAPGGLPAEERAVLADACRLLGELAVDNGYGDRARDLADAVLRLHQADVLQRPEDVGARRSVAADLLRIADLDAAAGRDADAAYRRHLRAMEQLVSLDADDPQLRRDLATAHSRLADHDRAAGRQALAGAGYRQAFDTLERLVTLHPEDREARRDLSIALTRLAELDAEAGWREQARARYRRAVALDAALLIDDPADESARNRLAAARERLTALDEGD